MWAILGTVLLGLLILLGLSKPSSNTAKPNQPISRNSIADIIIQTLTSAGYSETMAYCFLWVSKMETAYNGSPWNSPIFRQFNNLWGMKVSTQRKNTQTNFQQVDDIWAHYASVSDSALDLVYYLQARKYPKTVVDLEQLIALMYDKEYFVGESYESYLNKVKVWSSK